ncbi:hypothetical protein SDC9_07568 [bioreactor metagenome]|uniref:DUF2178 domain-containing protein n=1 Tax=bioreactor metagenome TaxID=1076179 RepID=A0A644T4X2_9ZZZZ|nr:DUF2178 domain-containing protein [Methanobrevibacter sp.]MEA4957022.1 DUF2178 domain-containing protein [Methanobrevibacter sp.]
MESKIKVIITIILSTLVTFTWVLGIIFANFNLFIVSMILFIIVLIPTIKYYKELDEFFKSRNEEIIEDERTRYIDEKASLPAFGSVMAIVIYVAIAIFTLRNVYPEYIIIAYAFSFTAFIGIIIYLISRTYFKRRYSN